MNKLLKAAVCLALGGGLAGLAGCAGIPDAPDNGGGALRRACFRGEFVAARRMVEEGADVNLPDPANGETPLMQAAFSGNLDLVKFLADRGAQLNARNNSGGSVLIHGALAGTLSASESQAAAVCRYLMQKGARPANDNEKLQVDKLLARFGGASHDVESPARAENAAPAAGKPWWESGEKATAPAGH